MASQRMAALARIKRIFGLISFRSRNVFAFFIHQLSYKHNVTDSVSRDFRRRTDNPLPQAKDYWRLDCKVRACALVSSAVILNLSRTELRNKVVHSD